MTVQKYVSRPAADDPRAAEAWALGEASRRLADAARSGDPAALRAALLLNQRLWTVFQAAADAADCPLPGDLRTGVAALSLLVDRETFARLADLDAARVGPLLEVNRSVAAGLAAPSAAAAPPAPPAPPGPLNVSV